jgi:bacterial/archaeal transporter family protein
MTWMIYALFSAITAALVTILSKIGLQEIDPTLATTIRSIIMSILLIGMCLTNNTFSLFDINQLDYKGWAFIILAALSGAASWLFYFHALAQGPAPGVAAIDRLSIVFIVLLSAILLGQGFTIKSIGGSILIAIGAYLISL